MSYSSKNDAVASTQDREPDTIATPEGDNEYPPDAPLQPAPNGLQTPPGLAPNSYEEDKPKQDKDKPSGVEKFIDEVARGEYM